MDDQNKPKNQWVADLARLRRRLVELEAGAAAQQTRFAGIIASAMDAIITVDANQHIVLFNAAAESMFRCSAAESVGQALDRFIPERFQRSHREHIRAFGRTGVTNRRMGALEAISGRRADGEEFPIEASISQAEIAGEKFYTVILRDITKRKRTEVELERHRHHLEELVAERTAQLEQEIAERKQAEAKLQQAYREIQHKAEALALANAELAEYDYAISHDLRAPLRAIRNYADFLREDLQANLAAEQKSYLDGLGQAVAEATTLIEDVLELSRVGRVNVPSETVQLGPFLHNLLAGLDLPADAAIELAADWPNLYTKQVLLRQVFQNLIENGLKFNQSSPQRLTLGWRPAADGAYELWVQDNGIGIDPRHQEQIFHAFQRLHPPPTYPGSGIGLAVVKKAIQKLAGSIRLESQPGQGSTFFITLADLPEEA